MDFQTSKETQKRASNSLRDLISLEQISTDYFITDIDDPTLYGIYKAVNQDKLTENEINLIEDTIECLKQNQQKINNYNLSLCVNDYTPQ